MYQSWCTFNTKAYKLSPSELPECLGGLDMAAQFRLPLSLSWLQVEAATTTDLLMCTIKGPIASLNLTFLYNQIICVLLSHSF